MLPNFLLKPQVNNRNLDANMKNKHNTKYTELEFLCALDKQSYSSSSLGRSKLIHCEILHSFVEKYDKIVLVF